MKWLRSAIKTGLATAAQKLRGALLRTAATVQYEAAREPPKQLGADDVPAEPFIAKQQRQSRMDGGEDEDGSLGEHVPVAPAVGHPHIINQRN